jgi:hypothetical protein
MRISMPWVYKKSKIQNPKSKIFPLPLPPEIFGTKIKRSECLQFNN